MSEMGRCRDCRWWDYRVPTLGPPEDGICQRVTTVARADDRVWIWGENAQLMTRPGFGCVQFEARP